MPARGDRSPQDALGPRAVKGGCSLLSQVPSPHSGPGTLQSPGTPTEAPPEDPPSTDGRPDAMPAITQQERSRR